MYLKFARRLPVRLVQRAQLVLEKLGKSQQKRRFEPALADEVIDDLFQVGIQRIVTPRSHEQVAARADFKIARSPGRHVVHVFNLVPLHFVHGQSWLCPPESD